MGSAIEQGDIYFFYRNKVDVERANGLDDVQRLFMVLAPDSGKQRLLTVGKKRMPDILPGKSRSTEREWMMVATVSGGDGVAQALKPVRYHTKSHGERRQSEAIPAGAGRYELLANKNDTRLVYKLKQPEKVGKAQRELGIVRQANYVISVRNPDLDVPGFPDDKPRYPKRLKRRFADERWLPVEETTLLDYKNAQLLLIGAKASAPASRSLDKSPHLFERLGLDTKKWPLQTLEHGSFATADQRPSARGAAGNPSKGGEHGGRRAVQSASASGVAKALKGTDFPCNRKALVDRAKDHQARSEIVDVLTRIPNRQFKSMADVQSALSEVR